MRAGIRGSWQGHAAVWRARCCQQSPTKPGLVFVPGWGVRRAASETEDEGEKSRLHARAEHLRAGDVAVGTVRGARAARLSVHSEGGGCV